MKISMKKFRVENVRKFLIFYSYSLAFLFRNVEGASILLFIFEFCHGRPLVHVQPSSVACLNIDTEDASVGHCKTYKAVTLLTHLSYTVILNKQDMYQI